MPNDRDLDYQRRQRERQFTGPTLSEGVGSDKVSSDKKKLFESLGATREGKLVEEIFGALERLGVSDRMRRELYDMNFGNGRGFAQQVSHEERLTQELDKLRGVIDKQNAFLKALGEASFTVGVVLHVGTDRIIVRAGSSTVTCNKNGSTAKRGDYVALVGQSQQIHHVIEGMPTLGAHSTVTRVLENACGVTFGPGERIVGLTEGLTVKVGDTVMLDESGSIVLVKLPRDEMVVAEHTGVSWDDIGGLTEAKEALREAIEYPVKYGKLYKAYNKRPAKGALLFGPPGNGKTMLAKAVATSLRESHGGGDGAGGFVYVKGPELLDKYVGATETGIRELFDQAREYKRQHGYPAVICLDEADALLGRRGTRNIGMETTVVPAFLTEMDGIADSGAFVLLLTNRPDTLDPAIVRDGRIDRRIEIPRPGREGAAHVLSLSLRGFPLHETMQAEGALENVLDLMFSDEVVVRSLRLDILSAGVEGTYGKDVKVFFRDVVSGALIAGVVNRAVERAIRRDRDEGAQTASGISLDDLRVAVHGSAREISGDLSEELAKAMRTQLLPTERPATASTMN